MTQILELGAAMYNKRMQRLGKEEANLARCKSREGKVFRHTLYDCTGPK